MKRWLYLVHRWLGIPLCLVMALWFFSGMVMLYVGYPKLSDEERLQGLAALSADGCCVPLAQALLSASHFAHGLPARHLGMLNEDAWSHSRALDGHRPLHVVALDDDPAGSVSALSGLVIGLMRWRWSGNGWAACTRC